MVAQTSIPDPLQAFRPDPERVTEFLDALASPDTSLQEVATAWNTTVGALCLFIESDAGLELLGGIEFALSRRLRITALSSLPTLVTTLNTIVQDCPTTDDAASANIDLPTLKLIEFKRNNARRAGALLVRMATYHPRAPRRVSVSSSQACATPERPLEHGEAPEVSTDLAHLGAACIRPRDPHLSATAAQTCGTSKRPLGRGEAPIATAGASPVRSSSTPTTSESSSAVVVHVGAANTPSFLPPIPSSRPPTSAESTLVASMPRRIPSRASSLAIRAGSSFPAGP